MHKTRYFTYSGCLVRSQTRGSSRRLSCESRGGRRPRRPRRRERELIAVLQSDAPRRTRRSPASDWPSTVRRTAVPALAPLLDESGADLLGTHRPGSDSRSGRGRGTARSDGKGGRPPADRRDQFDRRSSRRGGGGGAGRAAEGPTRTWLRPPPRPWGTLATPRPPRHWNRPLRPRPPRCAAGGRRVHPLCRETAGRRQDGRGRSVCTTRFARPMCPSSGSWRPPAARSWPGGRTECRCWWSSCSPRTRRCSGIALSTARELAGADVTESLVASLQKLPADRQALVILALADRGDAAVLPTMLEAAKSGRRSANRGHRALERLGDASCVPDSAERRSEADEELSQAARRHSKRCPATKSTRRLPVDWPRRRARSDWC